MIWSFNECQDINERHGLEHTVGSRLGVQVKDYFLTGHWKSFKCIKSRRENENASKLERKLQQNHLRKPVNLGSIRFTKGYTEF